MTLNNVIDQAYNLSVGDWFNSMKWTKTEFANYVKNVFSDPEQKTLVMEICLPDGRWMMRFNRYANGEFDYWIPETREDEKRIISSLYSLSQEKVVV